MKIILILTVWLILLFLMNVIVFVLRDYGYIDFWGGIIVILLLSLPVGYTMGILINNLYYKNKEQ